MRREFVDSLLGMKIDECSALISKLSAEMEALEDMSGNLEEDAARFDYLYFEVERIWQIKRRLEFQYQQRNLLAMMLENK